MLADVNLGIKRVSLEVATNFIKNDFKVNDFLRIDINMEHSMKSIFVFYNCLMYNTIENQDWNFIRKKSS